MLIDAQIYKESKNIVCRDFRTFSCLYACHGWAFVRMGVQSGSSDNSPKLADLKPYSN